MSLPYQEGMRYFDLYHGVELHPIREGDQSVLSFPFEAHGYGAVLATAGEPSAADAAVDGEDEGDDCGFVVELFASVDAASADAG